MVPVTHARVFALLPGESSSVAHSAVAYQNKAPGAPFYRGKKTQPRQTQGYRFALAGFGPTGIADSGLY